MRNEELEMRNEELKYALHGSATINTKALQSNAYNNCSLLIIHYALKTPKEFS